MNGPSLQICNVNSERGRDDHRRPERIATAAVCQLVRKPRIPVEHGHIEHADQRTIPSFAGN